MKKGSGMLLLICAFALCFVVGMFVGRNLRDDYVTLPQNDPSDMMTEPEEPQDFRLDINTATKAQLMDLPGIGEKIAERIIQYRTEKGFFQTIDDLMNVEGIGEKKLRQIEVLIRAGG